MSPASLPHCCPRAAIEIELTGESATTVTVAVRGEIDMDNGRHVEHTLAVALEAARRELVIDMSGVTFLGSVGMRVLVECRTAAESTGRHLVLAGVRPWDQRVLDMSGLLGFFDVRATEQA